MSKEIESISTELFNKIRSRFPNVTLGNEKAQAETDPENARFFNFTYTGSDGTEFGKVTISLIDETSLKAYFGQNISADMDRDQRKQWYEFLRNLRQFAKRNLLTFDTRDINKSNLQLQDIKQQAKSDEVSTSQDIKVTESKLYGTTHKSYADMGECRLLIKHGAPVSDKVRGDRGRRIEKIYIENSRGERFLLDHTNLHGARATARHLSEGGSMYDEIGECINNMVAEMSAMSHFVRSTKRRQFEDAETADMAQAATHHYLQLKNTLRHLANKKHYQEFLDSYTPDSDVEEEIDVNTLRERFVKKMYDERFDDALPYVARAYKRQQEEAFAQHGNELEEWADGVFEGTWAKPDNEDKVTALIKLLQSPLPVGMDGMDARSSVSPIIGNDELNDAIEQLAISHGPDADATALVKIWLKSNMPEVFEKVQASLKQNGRDAQTNFAQQTSPQQDPEHSHEYGATGMDWPNENPVVKESDDLEFIRSLAGLKK